MDMTENQLNDTDIELLQASFALLAEQSEQLVETFYEKLFEHYPSMQSLFANTDMKQQQTMLLDALSFVIGNLRDGGKL